MKGSRLKIGIGIIIGCMISVLFYSCDRNSVYSESIAILNDGWSKDQKLVFTPQIEENAKTYNIYFWVRHTKGYKYSNIWLKLNSDPSLVNDTTGLLEIPIADATGKWLGECTQSVCTAKILLKENFRFENTSAFRLEVQQYMREDNLSDIKNVGLIFELAE